MNAPERWRFGPFELDAHERQLRRGSEVLALTHKAFGLLQVLVGKAGKLCSKSELFERVWPGVVVTDASLSRAVRELRRVLEDSASEPRYIATVHGLGFRFIAKVEALAEPAQAVSEAGAPIALASVLQGPADIDPFPSPTVMPLVGRRPELQALKAAWDQALAGQSRIVLVKAAAGMGKTALVQHFIDSLPIDQRTGVCSSACVEQYGTVEPYLPWFGILERLTEHWGRPAMAQKLMATAPTWLAQTPGLSRGLDAQQIQQLHLQSSAARMIREWTLLLEELSAERALCLWLDDLHWSDPSSLDLLSYLASRLGRGRWLVVASLRLPDPADARSAPLQSLLSKLENQPNAASLCPGLLSAGDIGEYLQARFGPQHRLPMPALATFLHQRSSGHALFVVALVNELVRSADLVPGAEGWALRGDVSSLNRGPASSLRQLMDTQFAQLDTAQRSLLEAAAVAGSSFCAAAVAAGLGCHAVSAEAQLRALATSGRFLRADEPAQRWPDGSQSAGFAFLHTLYWQGVYQQITPARRALLHRLIGECEERAFGPYSGRIASELAMRFEAAHDLPRSLHYLRLAAHQAFTRHAYAEAAQLLAHAHGLCEDFAPQDRSRERLPLLLSRGAALMAIEGYAAKSVHAAYEEALRLARELGDEELTVRALRGHWNVALVRAELSPAQACAQELLARAQRRGDRALHFDALAKLGQTAMHHGDWHAARAHLDAALAQPLAQGEPLRQREAPRVLAYLSWVQWYSGQAGAALASAQQAVAQAELQAAGGPHALVFAQGFAAWVLAACGHWVAARDLAMAQRSLAQEHGLRYWEAWSHMIEGHVRAGMGDPSEGARQISRSIAEFDTQEAEVGLVHFCCLQAEAELQARQFGAAKSSLDRADALLRRSGNAYHAPEILRLRGDLCALRAAACEPAAPAMIGRLQEPAGAHEWQAAMALAASKSALALELRAARSLARAWAAQGRRAEAAALLEPLLVRAGSDHNDHATREIGQELQRWAA